MPTNQDAEMIAGYLGVSRAGGHKYLREGCPLDPHAAHQWLEDRVAARKDRTTKTGRAQRQRNAVRAAVAARGDLERILFDWVRHG